MTTTSGLLAKCAVLAAAIVGLFAASQFSERRSLPNWTTTAPESVAKPAQMAAAPVQPVQPPAAERSCADQTWPNIAKECITGRAEPARKEVRAIAGPESRASTSAAAARPSAAIDPLTTGAVIATAGLTAPPSAEPGLRVTPAAPIGVRPREAQRQRKPAPRVAAARQESGAPTRIREPIQFSLADRGN